MLYYIQVVILRRRCYCIPVRISKFSQDEKRTKSGARLKLNHLNSVKLWLNNLVRSGLTLHAVRKPDAVIVHSWR